MSIKKGGRLIAGSGGGGLPPQEGHAGEFLTTDGTSASWAEIQRTELFPIYQNKIIFTNGNVALQDDCSVYQLQDALSTATTFTFDTSELTKASTDFVTFEIIFNMTTVSSLTFPSSVVWLNGETPDTSKTGWYMFTFRKAPEGTTWFGCLEGRW